MGTVKKEKKNPFYNLYVSVIQYYAYLGLSLYGFHSANEFAVGLKEQQQLKMKLVQPPTQLQLLQRHRHGINHYSLHSLIKTQ